MFQLRRSVARAATAAAVPGKGQGINCRAARGLVAAIAEQQPQTRRAFSQSSIVRNDTFSQVAADPRQSSSAPHNGPNQDYRANDRKKSLFVGNIAAELTADDIREIFTEYAPVEDTVKGVGGTHWFVYFKDEETALKVQEQTNGMFVRGRQMRVQPRLGVASSPSTGGRTATGRSGRPAGFGDPSPTVFIGNMPYNMTDQDLNELSKKLEYCFDIRVAIDRHTGWPRGYAHADFYTVGLAQRALKRLVESRTTMGTNLLRFDFAQGIRGGTQSWTLSRLRALKTAGKTVEDYDKLTEELRAKEGSWETQVPQEWNQPQQQPPPQQQQQ